MYSQKDHNRFIARLKISAIIALFTFLSTIYSIVIPPFETPDEIWHFAFIQHLATGQGLPISEANTQALWRQQGTQAPGYYLAAAALTGWIDQRDFPQIYERANPHRSIGRPDATENRNYLIHHSDEESWPWQNTILALHIARFFSIFLGAVTLWATYKTLSLLLGDGAALLGTAVFAFIPQFIFISSAASNDNAVNALAGLILWRLVALLCQGPKRLQRDSSLGQKGREPLPEGLRRNFLLIGLLLGVATLSKLSALGLVGLAGLTVLYIAWERRSWSIIGQATLFIGLPTLLIGGWWYLRNWLLYADPLAWNIWQANILLRVTEADWPTIAAELGSLERSFWGLFGWLNIGYPDRFYLGFRLLTFLIGAGLLVRCTRWLWQERRFNRRWLGGFLLLLWLLILTLSWLRFMRIAPAAQGRYFFPAAPSLALLIAIGLCAWRRHYMAWGIAFLLFALSALTPTFLISATYRSPPQASFFLEKKESIQASFGEEFMLLDASASPAVVKPGDSAVVTLAWQALAPTSTDYSIFIHLVNEVGLTVAQRDTMPGGGLYPTSQWQEGERRIESYEIEIPEMGYRPDGGEWVVGLYNHQNGQRLPVQNVGGDIESTQGSARDSVTLGTVAIPTHPGPLPNPIQVEFSDNVTLAGYEFNKRLLRPGEEFTVTLYWQARAPIGKAYTTFVHLLDENFQTYGGHDGAPNPSTEQWHHEDMVIDKHTFFVSKDAPAGLYQIELGLYPWPDFQRLSLLASDGAEGADRLLLGPLRVEWSE